MSDNMETKVAKLEVTVKEHDKELDDHEKRIREQSEISGNLSRVVTLLENQMEERKSQDDKLTNVLDKMDKNLTNLNYRFDHMDKRVQFLEEDKKQIEKRKINLWYKVVGGILTAVATALVLLWLGLSK